MILTRAERWILANQYKILEALYPEQAESHRAARVAVESGYEQHYRWVSGDVVEDSEVMSEAECMEINEILTMWDALQYSYEQLETKPDINERLVKFPGFDVNNEDREFSYAQYYCNGTPTKRFQQLKIVNSHMPTMAMHRRMLAVWRDHASFDLSGNDIKRILEARLPRQG